MSMEADDKGKAIFAFSSFMRAATSVTSGRPCCVRVETNYRVGTLMFGVHVGQRPLISATIPPDLGS